MLEKILKENSTIPELGKDPLLTKDELEPKKSNFKLGDDGMFLQKEGQADESKDGIANKILEKMKQNKEEEKKKEEEPTTEEGKQSARALDKEIENLEKVKELIDQKIENQKKPQEETKDEKAAEDEKAASDKKEEKPLEEKKDDQPAEDPKPTSSESSEPKKEETK